mgnify:CR=1 FL=1
MKSTPRVAYNTYWNLLGLGAPFVIAIFAIPPLIDGLGTERFGVLTLGWMIMGYFALFDLGMGRATTKFVAECIERGDQQRLPSLAWGSLLAHVTIGLVGGGILATSVPWLVRDIFKIPADILNEVTPAFYLLAVSVPLVVASASLRGILEAIHRFDLVNAVKIPASILNYIAPLFVLAVTNNLAVIVGVIVVSRAIVLAVNFLLCKRELPIFSSGMVLKFSTIKPLIGFGGWLTVSSLVSPVIVLLDRFIIGTILSMSAVAYYATPYEVVTKLWIFSASLLGALFPVFSALSVKSGREIRILYDRSINYLLVSVAPIVAILLAFSQELLSFWIGPDFAMQSAPVTRWLAVGVLINVLAQVPFTVLQGMGKADVPAKLQIIQLPFYAIATWYLVGAIGITGAAIAWTIRAVIDACLLLIAAKRLMPETNSSTHSYASFAKVLIASLFLLIFWAIGSTLSSEIILKISTFTIVLILFILWEWQFLLNLTDRVSLISETKNLVKTTKWHAR